MKKTLVMIIAIVLILSVCLVAVGCPKTPSPNETDKPCTSHVDKNGDGKCDNCGTTMTKPPVGGDKEPTSADLDAASVVESYISAWLLNNANNQSTNSVKTEINALVKKVSGISSVTVDPVEESGKVVAYKLTYKFKDGAKHEQKVDVASANNGQYAGLEFAGATEGVTAESALVAIINGAFKTCKVAVENGQGFSENGFGFDATAYFDFYYGEMAQKLTYGLRIAGQIGIQAKDTFAAIEIVNGTNVVGGLYYEGAENKADCKLYLNAGDYKYYIDNADVNAIVVNLIQTIQGIIGGGNNQGQDQVNPALETPFYNTVIKSLADLGLPEMVGSLLPIVMNEINATKLNNDTTRYQIKIDLSTLLSAIKTSFGDALNGILKDLPAPLNQLDLGSFQGIGGVLLITADVSEANGLGGVELSYNAPKQDFRFNYNDKEAKVYGPINVAIGIKDFELAKQEVADVIPNEVSEYEYFSPLNAELNVDVVVNDVAYNANIVSSVNPFAVEDGVITFVVNKDNAAWMNGRIEIVSPEEDAVNGWNGLVTVSVDGEIYKFYTGEFATSLGEVLAATFGQVISSNNVFTPIVNYVMDLIAQFAPAQPEQPAVNGAGEEGGMDIGAITGAFGIVDAAKELIAQWQKDGVLVYKLDGEKLLDNYFQVKLSQDEYNAVVALVNQYIAPIIGTQMPEFTADAAKVLVSANYGEHAKQIYVSVDYKTTKVLVLLDGSKWESEKTIELSVKVNDDVYALVFDASEENVYNLTYTAKDVKYVDITLNLNDMTIAATLVANNNTHQFNGSLTLITEGDKVIGGTVTLNLDNVETKWTGKLAYGEVTGATSFGVPTVKFGAQFGWELPNNTTNVKVDVELVSWGQTVTLADNANLMTQESTANINDALQAWANAFLAAITVTPAE